MISASLALNERRGFANCQLLLAPIDRTRTALRQQALAPNGAELKGKGKWFFGEDFKNPSVLPPIRRP
jgi:hypothetical protein